MNAETTAERTTLRELALLFLRLGATAFGGPAAHISMMLDEVVRRRGWLSERAFSRFARRDQPDSRTQLHRDGTAHRLGAPPRGGPGRCRCRLHRAGDADHGRLRLGVYQRYGQLPSGNALLYGVKPVIVAVVAQAIWGLWPKAAKNWTLRALGGAAALAAALGVNERLVLFAAGALAALLARPTQTRPTPARPNGSVPLVALGPAPPWLAAVGAAAAPAAVTLPSLFWVFLKIGSVLFGSGYVLLAFLRTDLVERLGWLTELQLIDSIAVGQFTPGPVFTTATFIGYLLAGPSGALVATLGISCPPSCSWHSAARSFPACVPLC